MSPLSTTITLTGMNKNKGRLLAALVFFNFGISPGIETPTFHPKQAQKRRWPAIRTTLGLYSFGGLGNALAGGSGLPRPEIRGQAFCALEWDGSFAGFFRFMEPDTGDCGMPRPGLAAGGGGRDRWL